MSIDDMLNFALGTASGAATLVIISLGLAVIFGMMGVINFAHGEFIMLGAFLTLTTVRAGVPLPVAMLVGALAVGGFGMLVEMLLIRQLYGRIEATMLATFGLSLILVQAAVFIWGTTTLGIPTPFGSMRVGDYSIAEYRLVIIAAAIALLVGVWFAFTRTKIGLMARAAAADKEMAACLGINAKRINMYTFAFGSALAGAGGALLAPMVAVTPSMGGVYVPQAFMTVVTGGAGIITGTAAASGLLGTVTYFVSNFAGPVIGVSALLVVSIVILRVLPTGISGTWKRDL